ncbi:MAG: hypothetical protein AABY22_15505 [Nanoarchaeota archaeon]
MPKKIDFEKLGTYCFTPSIYSKDIFSLYGCGSLATAFICGDNPSKILKANRNRSHFSEKFIVNYLKKKNYQVIPLLKNVYKNKKFETFTERVKDYHVILASIRLDERQASWIVINNGLIWHNMEASKLKELDAFNFPIIDCYIVFHPKWTKGKFQAIIL